MDPRDKVFLITGASSGIGAATARAASAAGAKVVLAARRADRLEALAAELPHAVAVRTDVTDPAQVQAAVDTAVEAFGRLDVLVNNAGQGLHAPLEDVDVDDFRAVLELNVVAPLVALQAVLPVMRAQGAGAVVDVSSGTSRMVLPGAGAYAATKSALNMLSAVARRELAGDGVVVSTVYPFITDTEFHRVLRAGRLQQRPGGPAPHTAEHVAEAILDLVRSGEPEKVLVPEGFAR
ncbi:SDR family NAD(P)-dependent oxidoreductase [Kineococcus aurantiacus]|uniref:NADP-dependent 3-hydroxy acid dehydrogenase YdfG n=1 Tax=Kineococcus aurantiacus TaxID=37633 RepID=A0A7Y9DP61_9ACTN|nr:NADP-dependent 3-hydroxy acid dehydrogenase YdfG [Kineococcus aurantiacus]